ncbi:hypothetical protein GGU45_003470 [Niabella hirudinis]
MIMTGRTYDTQGTTAPFKAALKHGFKDNNAPIALIRTIQMPFSKNIVTIISRSR